MGSCNTCIKNIQKSHGIIALADCNSFFASCERVFDPSLKGKPVAVLSNNDGCIVARTSEVKELGIPMGIPMFKIRDRVKQLGIHVRSSNYQLYADMSSRVMISLGQFTDCLEVYSIDEAFLRLDHISGYDRGGYVRKIADSVYKWTGIPISIGVAHTKTLAKVASEYVKKHPKLNRVLDLTRLKDSNINNILESIGVGDIWGVGYRSVGKLRKMGIETALDLKVTDPQRMRRRFSLGMYHTVSELQGVACIDFTTLRKPKKSIACTRSFGNPVLTKQGLASAITQYISTACEKLRKQGSVARGIYIYIRSSKHGSKKYFYGNGAQSILEAYSADTRDFVNVALEELDKMYIPRVRYRKAGVHLFDILPQDSAQLSLFESSEATEDGVSSNLMEVVDSINKRWGSGTIRLSTQGKDMSWQSKKDLCSPRYTTNWNELMTVR